MPPVWVLISTTVRGFRPAAKLSIGKDLVFDLARASRIGNVAGNVPSSKSVAIGAALASGEMTQGISSLPGRETAS